MKKASYGFEDAKKLLADTTLGDFVAQKDGESPYGEYPPERPVVTVDLSTTVGNALRTLSKHRILSAPVLDKPGEGGEYAGMVDVADLLRGLIDAAYPELLDESYIGSHRTLCDAELQAVGAQYCAQQVQELLHDGDLWYRGDSGSTLLEVCTEGFRLGQPPRVHEPRQHLRVHHRIGVFDITPGRQTPDGPMPQWRVTNVLSQSDVIRLLADKAADLGGVFEQGVHQLELGTEPSVCVSGDTPALSAFARMHRERLSGLGIVAREGSTGSKGEGQEKEEEGAGVLVGTISMASLRGLTPERFGVLALPVAEFVAVAAAGPEAWEGLLFGKHPPGVEEQDWARVLEGTPLTCCAPDTPLREVLSRMADSKLHRCWVTETGARGGKPVGVITMTDVLRRAVA